MSIELPIAEKLAERPIMHAAQGNDAHPGAAQAARQLSCA